MNAKGLAQRMRKVEAQARARNLVHVWADRDDTEATIAAKIGQACAARDLPVEHAAVTVFRWADAADAVPEGVWQPRGTGQ